MTPMNAAIRLAIAVSYLIFIGYMCLGLFPSDRDGMALGAASRLLYFISGLAPPYLILSYRRGYQPFSGAVITAFAGLIAFIAVQDLDSFLGAIGALFFWAFGCLHLFVISIIHAAARTKGNWPTTFNWRKRAANKQTADGESPHP